MTAKESEQDKKGKFPLVTFVKLQATVTLQQLCKALKGFLFILCFSDFF